MLPEDDPTTLFIVAGMHPLVPYLSGKSHPNGARLANSQKCVRTVDLDEVGDATHLTFFEMLGNWSLGDFFKDEQIPWAYEFLFDILKLDKSRVAVSVFEGDSQSPRDEQAADIWKKTGINASRIAYLPASENWWAKGETGVCGPDTEIFYWTDDSEPAPKNYQETHEDERWVEIWNNVFMMYDRQADGSLRELPNKNIDTGMGLERTVAVLNGKTSVYETDAFTGILGVITNLAEKKYLLENITSENAEAYSMRIIADHIRSSVVLIADGVEPSNTQQGYILRRLIRRSVRHGRRLQIVGNFTATVAEKCVEKLQDAYPNVGEKAAHIYKVLTAEEEKFAKTVERGEKEFLKRLSKFTKKVDGETAFYLYETYGYPLEMTEEMAAEQGLSVDTEGFAEAQEKHKELSRTASAGQFTGGLTDQDPETIKLHSCAHLLQEGLRRVLGAHVQQVGQNITPDRARFDFTHTEKMTAEQKQAVEDFVNQAIAAKATVWMEEMTLDQAYARGALGWFPEKYGETVKVYFMGENGEWSKEVCGGPHIGNTAEISGTFKIKKEESCGAGKRRIKGVIVE